MLIRYPHFSLGTEAGHDLLLTPQFCVRRPYRPKHIESFEVALILYRNRRKLKTFCTRRNGDREAEGIGSRAGVAPAGRQARRACWVGGTAYPALLQAPPCRERRCSDRSPQPAATRLGLGPL